MDTHVTQIEATQQPSVAAVIAALAAQRELVVLQGVTPEFGAHTLIACNPAEVLSRHWGDPDPFRALQTRLREWRDPCTGSPAGASFSQFVGWIGYFAYEAGRYIERLPATTQADVGLPVARFAFYDAAAVYLEARRQWFIVHADYAGHRKPWSERQREWESLLQTAAEPGEWATPHSPPPVDNMTSAQYLRKVAQAREYIAAGDIFQVNFARRETFGQREPFWQTHLRLRSVNPAAYGAYLAWHDSDDEIAILSASPELFLQLSGRDVISRPIKGTRPRSDDPVEDERLATELARSVKDRAELAMIVDLVRNDLGRVCKYGSVRVVEADSSARPYQLERHPTVHHLVATVSGQLAPEHDAIDLVRACFPGGSITGAPKVRAMEIIDELEPTERSVYTGAIGIFGTDGSMTLNIAIRTMIATQGQIHIYAGGGIVADSEPQDEYEETCAKALGMRTALILGNQ